jgi:hypothetical protein
MTDARMPGHWLFDPTMDGLSDRAWRTFVGALMWSAEQGTDGQLPTRSLRHLYPDGVDEATATELVEAGRWKRMPSGYLVVDWGRTQSLAADVEKQRLRNRINVKAYRDRATGRTPVADLSSTDVSTRVSGDNSGDVSGDDIAVPGGEAEARQGAVTEEQFYETETPINNSNRLAEISRMTGCYECTRRAAMNPDQPPCDDHKELAA